jgi:pimeloyl-ACP methyl ester carboxylesterase
MPLRVVLLPGMDGTGDLFARCVAACPGAFETQVVSFPTDRPLGYRGLTELVRRLLPRDRRYVLLGESFSGPLALRLANEAPAGLAGVVLSASFVRAPVAARRLVWLGGVMGRARLPRWALARLLTGDDAELAEAVQDALARVDPAVLATRIRAIAHVDARDALRACPVPVVALRAAHDRLLEATTTDDVLAVRPDTVVRVVDAPHLLLQAAPDEAWTTLAAALLPRSDERRGAGGEQSLGRGAEID